MKKILLVGKESMDSADIAALRAMTQYLEDALGEAYEIAGTYLDCLRYQIAPTSFAAYDTLNSCDIADMDAIYIRGPRMRWASIPAYYLSRYCAYHHIPCVNDYSRYYPNTKVAQAILFLEHRLPFLATLYDASKKRLVTAAAHQFGFPYVLKDTIGAHGDSNHLIRSAEQVDEVLSKEATVDFLAQEFCPNDRDYRLLLLGDKNLTFERRGDADSHLNNTSKGGQARLADDALPSPIVAAARKLADELGLMIAGVDIMPRLNTDELYFLEINSQPQLQSGALLAQKQEQLRTFFDRLLH